MEVHWWCPSHVRFYRQVRVFLKGFSCCPFCCVYSLGVSSVYVVYAFDALLLVAVNIFIFL